MNILEALKRAKEEGITVSPAFYKKRVCYLKHETWKFGFQEEHKNPDSDIAKGKRPYYWGRLTGLFEQDFLGEWIEVEPRDPYLYE